MKRMLILLLALGLLTGCREQSREITKLRQIPKLQPWQTITRQASFQRQVLADCPAVYIALEGISAAEGESALEIQLENRGPEQVLAALEDVSVNGYMCDPCWAAILEPGEMRRERVALPREDPMPTDPVTQVGFTLAAYRDGEGRGEQLLERSFLFYPKGEAAAAMGQWQPEAGEQVLLDNSRCAMVITGFQPQAPWGYGLQVYLENRTEHTLIFTLRQPRVNGQVCDPGWAEAVAPGMRRNTRILWLGGNLAQLGITQVEALTLPVAVYDHRSGPQEALATACFLVTP